MKKYGYILILLGGGLLACKLLKKKSQGFTASVFSPIDTRENRIKLISLEWKNIGEPGAYYIKKVYENGDVQEYECVLDNPDDINIWFEQAKLDGATITEL